MRQSLKVVTLTLLCLQLYIKLSLSSHMCCCCDVSNYWDMNRTWTLQSNCQSPLKCCSIPTQEECELQLNPTYDGTCGHMNEKRNQQLHSGVKSQKIPRPSIDGELYGWFGQRLYDINGNSIEEWCIDNGKKDSFFLWRFVNCKGDEPNWFGRCAFPRATNVLIYKGCNDDSFEQTIPECFGEIQEMNIGLGDDYGNDIDYRYDVNEETLAIWCTNYSNPKNPPDDSVRDVSGTDDGIPPFMLETCRQSSSSSVTLIKPKPMPLAAANVNEHDNQEEEDDSSSNVMYPLTFRVALEIKKLTNNYYEIIIHGNNMPLHYEASIYNGDSFSISLNNKNINNIFKNIFINENINNDWKYNVNDNNNYVTFTYIGNNNIHLYHNIKIEGFIIELNIDNNNEEDLSIGWIARSNNTQGTFIGYGAVSL